MTERYSLSMNTLEKDPSKGLNAALAATLNGERTANGMTFEALAKATGISKRTLMRQLSTMERNLNVADVEIIARQFGLTPAEVFVMADARLKRSQRGDGSVSA